MNAISHPASIVEMTANITTAFVASNQVTGEELTKTILSIHDTLAILPNRVVGATGATPVSATNEQSAQPMPVAEQAPALAARPEPAVPIEESIQHTYLVCLEDGEKRKLLGRYIREKYGMTPSDYIKRWNLPKDYPMVSPAYSERRREIARDQGLGQPAAAPAEVATTASAQKKKLKLKLNGATKEAPTTKASPKAATKAAPPVRAQRPRLRKTAVA